MKSARFRLVSVFAALTAAVTILSLYLYSDYGAVILDKQAFSLLIDMLIEIPCMLKITGSIGPYLVAILLGVF